LKHEKRLKNIVFIIIIARKWNKSEDISMFATDKIQKTKTINKISSAISNHYQLNNRQ